MVILEGQLADIMSPEENRRGSAERLYNRKTLSELEEQYPEVRLSAVVGAAFASVPVVDDEPIIVRELGYYRALQKVFSSFSILADRTRRSIVDILR